MSKNRNYGRNARNQELQEDSSPSVKRKAHSSHYTPPWMTEKEVASLKARVALLKQSRLRVENLQLVSAGTAQKDDTASNRSSLGTDNEESEKKKSASSLHSGTDTEAEENAPDSKPKKGTKVKPDKKPKKQNEVTTKKQKEDLTKKGNDVPTKKELKKVKSAEDQVKDPVKGDASKDKTAMTKKDKRVKPMENKDDMRMLKYNKKEPHPDNPTGNIMAPDPQRELNADKLEDHLWATNYEVFNPQLYQFKSPDKMSTKNPVTAECPPFWVLLDHTIAVIWKLYCPSADRKDLGIVPLQWSREFVSALKNDQGEYLTVIGHVLNAIEDALIDRYAKMSDDKPASQNATKGGNTQQIPGESPTDENGNMAYISSESIFKSPIEVSYTLKDIMSRNLPGRQNADTLDRAIFGNEVAAAVVQVDIPPPDVQNPTKDDMIKYLHKLKEEQDALIDKEKEYARKIDALMDLVNKGKVDNDTWLKGHESKKKEHVSFSDGQPLPTKTPDTQSPAQEAVPVSKETSIAEIQAETGKGKKPKKTEKDKKKKKSTESLTSASSAESHQTSASKSSMEAETPIAITKSNDSKKKKVTRKKSSTSNESGVSSINESDIEETHSP